MDTNVIKEYLIGLGFKVNEDSLSQVEQSISNVEGAIKNFSNSNKDNMSSMESFFKLFGNSIKDNLGIVSKVIPEAKLPLLQIVSFAELLYKGIAKVSKGFKNVSSDKLKDAQKETKKTSNTMQELSKKTKEAQPPVVQLIALIKELNNAIDRLSSSIGKTKVTNFSNDMPKMLGQTSNAMTKASKESGNTTKALAELRDNGGKAVEEFAESAGISLGVVAAGFAAFIAAAVVAWKILTSLANQDLGYQKLAMQLWTTKENAREIDMALKTMKVSMQDLWLSPELLQQFNQLRKDSSQLKLPSDAEDNLKRVRSITFEFQRLKQAGSLAFQWIGYYILKYCAGPLADIHEALNSFTNGLLKNIPSIAKVIGTVLGIVFRLILTVIEALGIAIHPILSLIQLVMEGLGKLPTPIQNIIKLIALIGVAIMLGPWGAILMLTLALDDLFTYIKGGHSVIGSFFSYFKEKGSSAIDSISKKYNSMKNGMKSGISTIKSDWNTFWKSVESYIDKAMDKFKTLEEKIKNSKIGKQIENAIPNIKSKVEGFAGTVKKDVSSITSYIMPQSTTTNNKTSTANNANSTTNTFNIYGTNPTSTANAVNSKINNGIKTRNLQGVIQ